MEHDRGHAVRNRCEHIVDGLDQVAFDHLRWVLSCDLGCGEQATSALVMFGPDAGGQPSQVLLVRCVEHVQVDANAPNDVRLVARDRNWPMCLHLDRHG